MRPKTLLTLALLYLATHTQAQFYKAILPSQAFSDSLRAIVVDYQTNYRSIQAEEISSTGDADIYRSAATIPGASACMIYRFHSSIDSTASWQAIMYKGESYKEASKVYKNTFRLVNKARLHSNELSAGFSGQMEEPVEDLRFTSSSLRLTSKNELYRNYVAEIELLNTLDGWEVHLNLHYKRDDKEKY